MKKKNLIIVIVITAVTSLVFSCKETGTDPNQKPFKDPRQMIWTADTLPVPLGAIQVLPQDMLVISPTDVWLATWVGHGQIMHFDGKVWTMVKEIGGGIDCLVKGNSNDIWAGGYSNNIYMGRYDGKDWTRSDDMGITGEILDMCTDPSGNIWACGRNGVVLEYTQGKWIADTIKVNHYSDAEYFLNSIVYYKSKINVLTRVADFNRKRDVYHYVTGNIKNWTVVDSMVIDQPYSIYKWGQWKFYTEADVGLYSMGNGGVWKLNNNVWEQIFSKSNTVNGISGPTDNYLIAAGDFQTLIFTNGSNWQNIINVLPTNDATMVLRNVWTDGYEIFIAGHSTINGIEKTIVWHGK